MRNFLSRFRVLTIVAALLVPAAAYAAHAATSAADCDCPPCPCK